MFVVEGEVRGTNDARLKLKDTPWTDHYSITLTVTCLEHWAAFTRDREIRLSWGSGAIKDSGITY
jgi:hypothetical protein